MSIWTKLETQALSPAAFVVMTSNDGLLLPAQAGQDEPDPEPVSLPGLRLLCELAGRSRGRRASDLCADVDAETDQLEPLVQAIEARGWLIPVPEQPQPSFAVDNKASSGAAEPSDYSDDNPLIAELPQVFHICAQGIEVLDHEGGLRARLAPDDLAVLNAFRDECKCSDALERLGAKHSGLTLDEDGIRNAIKRLYGTGLLYHDKALHTHREMATNRWRAMSKRMTALTDRLDEDIARRQKAETLDMQQTGKRRIRVIPVMRQRALPPLALGMLMASARAHDNGRLQAHYHFLPDWEPRIIRLEGYAREASVFLFSNYIWSHEENLGLSKRVKEINSCNLTIHGGPDVPKYPGDTAAYFREHPHVDIAVHGEGEQTLCHILEVLAGRISDDGVDLSPLKHVPGLSFRDGEEVVRTAPRQQIADLNALPSPYLDSSFGIYEQASPVSVTLESNRGCPYGCTFCDWGSATASKVRRFDLERVFAELEWCARNQVSSIFLADANFGMFERDVEIAKKVAELKRRYGYPKVFTASYAKNKVKYIKQIVARHIEAGVLTEGLLSLQSMDTNTLEAVDRSNIKTEKYDELATEFRKAGLPLFVDIMLGLPGSTYESFAGDLQQCIDREVAAKIFQTELLVNSPMNAPAYREKYQIETATAARGLTNTKLSDVSGLGRNVVVATSTFTREDYQQMLDLRQVFRVFENCGVLRHVSRFMRQAADIREIDFIDTVRRQARANPERWPHLAFTVKSMSKIMVPPGSWLGFINEVRDLILSTFDVVDDTALETVLAVQHAVLPSRERQFPYTIRLQHDFSAWHRAMINAKDAGDRETWQREIPPLSTFPPAAFEVTDPAEVCKFGFGFDSDDDPYNDWELMSPVARFTSRRHLEFAESA